MIDPHAEEIAAAAATLRAERARTLMHWPAEDEAAWARVLAAFGETTYLRTILQELERNGISLTPQIVADTRTAWGIHAIDRSRDLAATHARSIVATHNATIDRTITTTLAKHPTYNTAQLVGALRRSEAATWDWKVHQINETFRSASYQAAFEDYYRNNPDHAALFEFGGSLQCPICHEIAAANPYTLTAMADVDDPPHPGCLDVWEPVS